MTNDQSKKPAHEHETVHAPENKYERKEKHAHRSIENKQLTPEPEVEKYAQLNETINEFVDQYNEAIEAVKHEVFEHSNNHAQFQHHIKELHIQLSQLEASHHAITESNEEKKLHFFNHHADALKHANEHWFHAKHHYELMHEAFIEEELEALEVLHHRITHLLQAIAQEKHEAHEKAKKEAEKEHYPHPQPHPEKNEQ